MTNGYRLQEELFEWAREEAGDFVTKYGYSWNEAVRDIVDKLRTGSIHLPSDTKVYLEAESLRDSYDDEGGSVYVVFEVVSNGEIQYFRVEGYTTSWDGDEWETTLEEVRRKPKQTFDYVAY